MTQKICLIIVSLALVGCSTTMNKPYKFQNPLGKYVQIYAIPENVYLYETTDGKEIGQFLAVTPVNMAIDFEDKLHCSYIIAKTTKYPYPTVSKCITVDDDIVTFDLRNEYLNQTNLPEETKDAIRKGTIKLGFTQEMVLASWGYPDRKSSHVSVLGRTDMWAYKKTTYKDTLLHFDNKVLTSWSDDE